MNSERFPLGNRLAVFLALAGLFAELAQTQAAPTILSTVPANGATGVSPTTTIVFTFSEVMNPDETAVLFYDAAFNFHDTTDSWNVGNTILTCTPNSAFPMNTAISWVASGENPGGEMLGGLPIGAFTVGGSGGGGGSGTNAITTFSVGKVHHYNQLSAGTPTLDPITPYGFSGVTALSSTEFRIL